MNTDTDVETVYLFVARIVDIVLDSCKASFEDPTVWKYLKEHPVDLVGGRGYRLRHRLWYSWLMAV